MSDLYTRETILAQLLLEWFRDENGIADEMTWSEIERSNERYEQLLAVGLDPYKDQESPTP